MKRQLDEREVKVATSNLGTLKEDLGYYAAMLKKTSVNIEVAPFVYKKQLEGMKAEQRGIEEQVNQLKRSIEILEDQLQNGVEILEKQEN